MEQRRPGLGGDFRRLFTANLASSLGDGIARTASPLLAVQLTDDPVLVSGVAALAMLPWLLFAIPAGMVVDRVDRRVALAVANLLRALLALALLAMSATDTLSITALYVVIFLYGMGETVYDGAVRAVVPSIVAKRRLPQANGRIEAGESIVQNFLAGPFTSLLFAVTVLVPLGTNAAAFALAAGLALALPKAASARQFAVAPGSPREPWYRALAVGFRFILSDRMLVTLWLLSTFIGLCWSAANATLVLYLVEGQGLPVALFGVFLLSGAVGGILGSFAVQRLAARLGAGRTMALANLLGCVGLIPVGVFPSTPLAAAMYFVTSFTVIVWNVLVMSLRQSIIPGRLLGRVHGSWRTVLWGAMPIGSILGGAVASISLDLPWIVFGGLASVAAVIFFRFLTRLPDPGDIDNGDRPLGTDGDAGPADPRTAT